MTESGLEPIVLETVNLRVQRLLPAQGAPLELRIEQHDLTIYAHGAEVGRLRLRALQSANSPEATPLYLLEQASLPPPHQALLTAVVEAGVAMFSRYTGGRVRIAKQLQTHLDQASALAAAQDSAAGSAS